MKTNQLLTVNIGPGKFDIEHKTKLGDLKQVWDLGNLYRKQRGLNGKDLKAYLQSKSTREFIIEIERKMNLPVSPLWSDVVVQEGKKGASITSSKLFRTTKGRYSSIYAHLYILIDAAMCLDPKFKLDVIEVFVEGKLLRHRDESGDAYKAMNIALDIAMPLNDKQREIARYMALANAIADHLKLPKPIKGRSRWNEASYDQLEARSKIEEFLTALLRNGFAKDFSQILSSVPNILG